MQKFIFDLDYTLLIPDWSMEDKFFEENLSNEEFSKLMPVKQQVLDSYEKIYPRYDLRDLSLYFKKHGVNLSVELIRDWMEYNGENMSDTVNEGAVELLEYLKRQNKNIVLLTNWFSATQIRRLKRAGLIDYFDQIICGDDAMKSSEESFRLAVLDTPKNECIMIGDNKVQDYKNALRYGINAYLIDENNNLKDLLRILKENERFSV